MYELWFNEKKSYNILIFATIIAYRPWNAGWRAGSPRGWIKEKGTKLIFGCWEFWQKYIRTFLTSLLTLCRHLIVPKKTLKGQPAGLFDIVRHRQKYIGKRKLIFDSWDLFFRGQKQMLRFEREWGVFVNPGGIIQQFYLTCPIFLNRPYNEGKDIYF